MPIARRRGVDNVVRYLVTTEHRVARRASGVDYEAEYTDGEGSESLEPPSPTSSSIRILTPLVTGAPRATTTSLAREALSTAKAYYQDDGDDDKSMVTMTMVRTLTPTSGATAAGQLEATETYVTVVPARPPPPPPHRGGLSQTTEHLLIAAGSIGATIFLILIGFGIYVMRKRSLTVAQVFRNLKDRKKYKATNAEPKGSNGTRNWTTPAYSWGRTQPFDRGQMKSLPTTPRSAVGPSGSGDARDPFSDEQSITQPARALPPSSRTRSLTRTNEPRSFLLDSPPRNPPSTTSSPRRQSSATHRTQTSAISSELQYPQPLATPSPISDEAVPTFRQFLFNRSNSNAQAPLQPPPMISRFSWTNSQGPQTPAPLATPAPPQTPAAASSAAGRESVATSRSSVPRFRTIDSWVSQQASRVEEQRLREQIKTQGSVFLEDDDETDRVPDVPLLPKNVQSLRDAGVGGNRGGPGVGRTGSLTRKESGRGKKDAKRDTQASEATVFRQHPGQEVRMSTRSLVPSEILNSKMRSSVL